MNDTSLFTLENNRQQLYKYYGVDSDSIKEFMSSVATVSEEEANALGKELFELISKKGYNDSDGKAVALIKRGANVEYKNDKKGDYALLVCARKGYIETFKALIKRGANVNQVNNYFTTALMAAARHGRLDMVKILLLFGADINARCLDGDNALFSAKRHGQKACFDELLKANAILTTKNLANDTFLDVEGDVSFDTKFLESRFRETVASVREEDATELLDEAKQKVKSIFPY